MATDENPDIIPPIHLGELLKEEPIKTTGAKKIVMVVDNKKINYYRKAALSELSGAELTKRQQDDAAAKIQEQQRRNNLKKKYEEEIEHSKINRMKLMNDWRVIMRIAKIDEIRKYLNLFMQIFERDLDDKDAILQMLDRDISEAEDHYNIALTNHFIHIKQLIFLQDSRVKGLFREFEKDVTELENEFNSEFEEIKKQFDQEQNEILKMLRNITDSYNRKIQKLNQDFQELKNSQIQKINEIYSHIQEAIKKAGTDVHNKFSNEMNDIKQKSDDKNRQDAEGIERLAGLEKDVLAKKKKVEKHNDSLKQLKLKIKQNNEDWDKKNDSLKKEKERVMMSYRILKNKLISFRNMQREKLKKLVKNSWDCVTKLKNNIKLAEKILKLAEISRRLEIQREKILPYYENTDVGKEEDNQVQIKLDDIKGVDPIIYEEIESLQNFWKRYNKVKLDVIAIKKQKNEIEKQNELLKNYLQQYYDGFHVNNVVMTNDNPLLRIERMNPNPTFYVVDEPKSLEDPVQEENKIITETKKQKIGNYIPEH
jgi:uncharacterized protein YukE